MANTVVGIDLIVALEQFRARMGEIPGITKSEVSKASKIFIAENKAMFSATQQAAQAAQAGFRQVAASTNATTAGLRNVNAQLLDIAKSAASGVSPLTILTQQGDQLAQAMAQAGGARATIAALGAQLAAIAPYAVAAVGALAPIAGHLAVMSREATEAADRAAFLADHLHDLDAATRRLEDAQIAAAVAMGRFTKTQGELIEIEVGATRAVDDFRQAQEKERAEATESYFAADRRLRQLALLPDVLSTAADYYGGYTSAQAEAMETIRRLDKIEGDHQQVVADTAAELKRAAIAEEADKAATDAAAEAKRRAREAAATLAAQLRDLTAAYEAQNAAAEANESTFLRATDGLRGMEAAAKRATATDEERIEIDRKAALATAARYRDEAVAAQSSASARETIAADYTAAERAINDQAAAEYQKVLDKRAEAERRAAEERVRAAEAAAKEEARIVQLQLDSSATIADQIGSIIERGAQARVDYANRLESDLERNSDRMTRSARRRARERIEAERAAARDAFAIAKGLALGAAIVNTASGVAAAIDDAPWPANLLPIAAAGATGAAEIATIASTQPSFARGTADGVPATLHPGEAVLTPTATDTLGQAEIGRLNAGQSPGPIRVVSEVRYLHHAFNEFIGDNLRRGGPLPQKIQGTKIVGHREDR